MLLAFIMMLSFSQVSAKEVAPVKQCTVSDAGAGYSTLDAAENPTASHKIFDRNVDKIVLFVLAIIIPPLAVGLHTDWEMPTLWNLLWTFIGFVPGVIHAFYILLTK